MTNYQAMAQRIAKANTVEAIDKVETSLNRIYDAGILTVSELMRLDSKLVDKRIKITLNF